MIFVIGSGPAGVACTLALLARGLSVTMLDAGVALPPDTADILNRLQARWDDTLAHTLKHRIDAGNPLKLSYGSDYPYAEVAQHVKLRMDEKYIQCFPSFAQGGLSNVWGAFIGRCDARDMSDWPLSRAAFDPHYDAVFSLLHGAVSAESPQAATAGNVYRPSAQAHLLLSRWRQQQASLETQGIRFAPAELAVKFGRPSAPHCNYSGNCMHGCPLDLIYSTRHTLAAMLKNPRFRYIPNRVVAAIRETPQSVIIESYDRLSRETFTDTGVRVFSACGAIISTKLALEAANHRDKVTFRDSMHFMLPAVMHDRAMHVEQERLHTLAQLYLKIERAEIAPRPVHLQLYTYMDHYTDRLKQLLRFAYDPLHPLLSPLIDRLIALQGHLHSSDSHGFTMHMDDTKTACLEPVWNARVPAAMKALMRTLRRNAPLLKFTPLTPMNAVSRIGKSFHYGSSLPMSANPKTAETDTLGRPFGSVRWHIVDASVLPSIPAGSITPTIMANAHRIAMEHPV